MQARHHQVEPETRNVRNQKSLQDCSHLARILCGQLVSDIRVQLLVEGLQALQEKAHRTQHQFLDHTKNFFKDHLSEFVSSVDNLVIVQKAQWKCIKPV